MRPRAGHGPQLQAGRARRAAARGAARQRRRVGGTRRAGWIPPPPLSQYESDASPPLPPGTNWTHIFPPPGTFRTRIFPPPGTNRVHISPRPPLPPRCRRSAGGRQVPEVAAGAEAPRSRWKTFETSDAEGLSALRERAAAVAKRFQGTFTRTTWDPDFDGKHEDRPLWFRCKRNHEFLASVWQVVPRHPRARGVLVPALYRSGCNCCALFWRPSGRWSSTRSNSRTSRGALPAARPTASARGSRRARATAHGRTFSRARGTRTTSTPS